MSDRPAGSTFEFSTPAPFFLLVGCALAMTLGATIEIPGILVADRLAHAFQPVPRPRKLYTHYRKTDRDDDQRRTGRHDHDDPDEQNGDADHANRDPTRHFVRKMNSLPDQTRFPELLILQRAIVACSA